MKDVKISYIVNRVFETVFAVLALVSIFCGKDFNATLLLLVLSELHSLKAYYWEAKL